MRDLLYLFIMNLIYVIRTPSTDQANTYSDTLGNAYDTDQPVPNQLDYDKWSRGFKRQLHFCGESSSKILMVISNNACDTPAAPACLDTDSDKEPNSNDNCFHPNPDQKDTDGDFIGDL